MSKYRQPGELCAVEGCDREAVARIWCNSHWSRWRRTGDPGPPFRPRNPDFCCIVDCGRPCACRGMCELHYRRWRLHGDPFHERVYGKGEDSTYWGGDDITYISAHFRVRRTKGPATNYACVQCEGPAHEWAYDHADPDEKDEDGKGTYSTKIEHYRPMCRRCHTRFDCDPMRPWAPWRKAARELADLVEGRPGWYISLRGSIAHYGEDGAGANWRTACGSRLRWPGSPVADAETVEVCERCHCRAPAGAIDEQQAS